MVISTEKATIFHGLRFFLTRTLSRDVATEVRQIIEHHGGVVSSLPAGATVLVDYDKLDSRRPEWVSTDFIYDSVASGALQDPIKYSGVVFSFNTSSPQQKGRVRYSVEDDARLLHFAKVRGWESMKSVPASTWKLAESSRVTNHSWQSMHERFRKQLQSKTPKEQRVIMARAMELIHARLQQSTDGEEMKEDFVARASPSVPIPTTREPTTPASTGSATTPATSSPSPRREKGEKMRQERKRRSHAISSIAESSHEEEEKDGGINIHDTGVVFFRSAWAEFAADPSKKARLQALFDTDIVQSPDVPETSSTESLDCDSRACREAIPTQVSSCGECSMQPATEEEFDAIICQLQLETEHDLPVVVNALYYCSGNVKMAKAFLKGAKPSSLSMWSSEDDLLLGNLLVDENLDRSAVEAAVSHGDFASMQVPRDTDVILDRVHFLR